MKRIAVCLAVAFWTPTLASSALMLSLVVASVLIVPVGKANAEFISYVANIETSTGNPMTDILILEEDTSGIVQASVFGSDLPGFGTSVIGHDPGFDPVRSLILGLTEGADETGAPKTQIMAFLDDDFAAANVGRKWSEVFVGSRHSLTINSLTAAVAGDMAERAWFTDTFYPGPADGAAFATGGSFTVAEFTGLNLAGSSAVNGNWIINSLGEISVPGEMSGSRLSFDIDETAVDLGSFDIELALSFGLEVGVDKTVLNDSGDDWKNFVMELGTTVNGEFIPSTAGDGLGFIESANFPNREETGAFPNVFVEEDRLVFTGDLHDGFSAQFITFIDSDTLDPHAFTLRQFAVIPEPGSLTLFGVGAVLLLGIRRRRKCAE